MKNLKQIILFALAVLSLIINLFAMQALPEKIGMQISVQGQLQNYVPKTAFLFAAPALLAIMYIFARPAENADKNKMFFAAGLIFVLNVIMIVFNLRAA